MLGATHSVPHILLIQQFCRYSRTRNVLLKRSLRKFSIISFLLLFCQSIVDVIFTLYGYFSRFFNYHSHLLLNLSLSVYFFTKGKYIVNIHFGKRMTRSTYNFNSASIIAHLQINVYTTSTIHQWVAAIDPWFHLHLPACSPGFESQPHHLHFFQIVILKLQWEKDKNKQKEAGIGPKTIHHKKYLYSCEKCL